MNTWVTIKTFDSSHTANMAKECLLGEGLDVFLKNELTNQIRNYPNASYLGVELQVLDQDAERAFEVLIVYGYAEKIVQNQSAFIHKLDGFTKRIPLFGELFFELRMVAIIAVVVLSVVIPVVLLT